MGIIRLKEKIIKGQNMALVCVDCGQIVCSHEIEEDGKVWYCPDCGNFVETEFNDIPPLPEGERG